MYPLDAALPCKPCDCRWDAIEIAQQDLGHASLATTTIYVTTEKRRRMKAVEAFWRK
jgi:integrase